ncbi:MAG TPA: hypothetical protein VKY89_19100 [Thermoanaerobaculia bacterium]|nr:hypothetical protein [Thermoanaerobaculia bacterium]
MITARLALLAALIFSILATPAAIAGPCAQPGIQVPVVTGTGELDLDGSTVDAGTMGKAIGDWQSSCTQYGTGFPTLVPNGKGGFPVAVTLHPGPSSIKGGRCGITAVKYQGGKIVSATIDVWTQQANGSPCSPAYDNLAHEIGHLLGEADAPAGCNGHIMGAPAFAGSPRTVFPDDCSDVDSLWMTPKEQAPPPPPNQCPPDCICPPTCQSGCDANGVCQDSPCLTDPTAPGCGGEGGGTGGGGGGVCDPDNPCDDGGGGGIIVPPPSPPPPRHPGAGMIRTRLSVGCKAASVFPASAGCLNARLTSAFSRQLAGSV